MRIVVAKKDLLNTFANPILSRQGVCEGRATANMPCTPRRVWLTLLCFSIWSIRESISFPDDMRCAGCAGCAGRGAVAIL